MGNAQSANLTTESNFIQSYGSYLLTGSFTGFDTDGDGLITKNELSNFSLFFNHGEKPIFQELSNLKEFSYTLDSDSVTKIVSNSTETIYDGTINSIDYEINALTPSLLAEQSSIALITRYSDGRIEESAFLSESPISVAQVIPLNTIPEGSNVIALLVLGVTIVSLKGLKK